jgi:hypothetical protein
MKKKIFIGIAVFLLLIIAALVATPFIFKDKINARVKLEINKRLNATVNYTDYGLSLIRSFPNFTLTLSDFSVTGQNEFKGDTLVYIKDLGLTLDIMSVINGGTIKILAINLDEPNIKALVNETGKANWDIMKPTPPSASGSGSSEFAVEIKKYKISKGNIVYDDKQGNTYASIKDLDFEGKGDVTQDLYDFVTSTQMAELTVKSGGVPYMSRTKVDAKIDLSIDNKAHKYTFKDNEIKLNDLQLLFTGYAAMPDTSTTNLDITFKSPQSDFKSILSLIPAIYMKDFDKVQAKGTLALSGSVKGKMKGEDYPAIKLNLNVGNAMFKYPDLPTAVNNINILANIDKPQGKLDLLVIDVPKLHADIGSDPVDAKINVRTPISDPDVKASVHGKLNLANVPKFYPMEGVNKIEGLLLADLDLKTKMSDIDNKRYEEIYADGKMQVTNLVYDSKDVPMPLKVSDLQMTFNPRNVTVSNLAAVIGKSDFNVHGTLDNFIPYLFDKGDLIGDIILKSRNFDVNEWLTPDDNKTAAAKADTGRAEFFKVPKAINLTASSEIAKITYDKLVLQNVMGTIKIKDETIDLQNLFANVLGGNATISATYDTKNRPYPKVDFTYDINNFDIQQTYQFVGMAQKMAPVMKHIDGNFSSDLKGAGSLNPDMSVNMASLTGEGKVEIPYAKITGMPVIDKIAEVSKLSFLKNLEMKQAMTILKFKDGKVNVDPFDLKLGPLNANIKGANGFDKTIDYDMRLDVPTSMLGGATSMVSGMLPKVPGVNFAMPETVNMFFKVTGTPDKPQVKLAKVGAGNPGATIKETIANTVDDLKKKAEEEARKKAEEAKQKATEEFNKQKAEAERKAKEAADKVKKEAEQKIKDKIKLPW